MEEWLQAQRAAIKTYKEARDTTNAAYEALRDYWIAVGGRLNPRKARAMTDRIVTLWHAVEAERKDAVAIAKSVMPPE